MCEDPMIRDAEIHGYPTQEFCDCGEALEGNAKVCDKCIDRHENEIDDVADDERNFNR